MNRFTRAALSLVLLASTAFIPSNVTAQNLGDYRSAGTGLWNTASTWQRFDGTSFVAAQSAPTSTDGIVTISAGHTVSTNSSISIDQLVVAAGGTLLSSSSTFTVLDGPGTDMLVSGTWQLNGANVEGPGTMQIAANGNFSWVSGALASTSVLNVGASATTTVSGGTSTLNALGTINNSGTWNLQSGNMGQSSFVGGPCAFNNLTGGVVNLNGWESTTNSWHQVTNNQGTINKNGGTTTFSFSSDFSGKAFNNLSGGAVNVPTGTMRFALPTTNAAIMTGNGSGGFEVDGGSSGSSFTNQSGGTISGRVQVLSGTMNVESALTLTQLEFSGQGINGPEAITIPNGCTLNWSGGALAANSVLNLAAGSTATFNAGIANLSALGTINNSGTWNMESGSMGQASFVSGPCAFNNLPSGVVNLNGWESTTSTWHLVTNNQGTFNKNNGTTTFSFSNAFSGKVFNNLSGGVLNVPTGTVRFALPTINASTMTGNSTGGFEVDGGSFTNQSGGTVSGRVHMMSGNLNIEAGLSLSQLQFSGGLINGPEGITISNGGTFNWSGGTLAANSLLGLAVGSTGTFSGGASTLAALGTINNSGTWNMQSGNMGQPTFNGGPLSFNNLSGGVVNLNGWETPASSWHQVTTNHGTFNKNNGAMLFTFSDPFSGKSFTNMNGGVVNLNSGTLDFALPMPAQSGVFNVASGTTLTGNVPLNFEGTAINNNGSITVPTLRFQAPAPNVPELNGTGSITTLVLNGGEVQLGGTQTVTGTATFTAGRLLLGDNDLIVTNTAANATAGGNSSSFCATTGSGQLKRELSSGNNIFQVGIGSRYTPITLGAFAGPQDRFGVRALPEVNGEFGQPGEATGSVLSSDVVGITWVVQEETPGASTADVTVQWNNSDELPNFGRTLSTVARYDGNNWITSALGPALGAEPFTRSISGVTSFREFCVSDGDAMLNDIGTGIAATKRSELSIFPNPCNEILYVESGNGTAIRELQLLDLSGRRVLSTSGPQVGRISLATAHLPSGTYILEVIGTNAEVKRSTIVLSH